MEIFRGFYLNLLLASMLVSAVSEADRFSEALLSLKSELADNYNSLSDWIVPPGENPSQKIHACSWSGVTCNKNLTTVTGLDLSGKNLDGVISGKQFNLFTELVDLNLSANSFSGRLPVEIFNLNNLRSLDISRNNFSGHFPVGISALRHLVVLDALSNSFSGPLPSEVSQLELLRVFNLAGSYFIGPIPPEYGSFKSLEFIHLAGNFLSGNIPPELGKLKTLTHMEIGYNSYQGGIPWQLGNMSELQYLDIAGANLSGPIPKELSNLTNLQSLFLFKNQLTGSIPREFSRISALRNLDLSVNQISGAIPESFAWLKNLRLLSLMYNDMSGSVPEGIARLPLLDALLIWNNFFSGSLPPSLGMYSKLKTVDVSSNNFIGSIPPGICDGGVLLKLMLFSNNFTGRIPPSLSNCSSLVRLRLEDNSFSGEIPLKFSRLSNITYVDLSRNKFIGGIPSDVSQSSKLQHFNVSENPGLGGTVPAQTWSLSFLQNFSASSCNISGNLPPFQVCKSVYVIELGGNILSGSVPDSISKCWALERLDLADNNLTGPIPLELAGLPALEVLDLSQNNFSGPIPMRFSNSSTLVLLNVSFNDISGSIPSAKRFGLMGASAFVGNPKLCGAPLQPCADSKDIQHGLRCGSKLTWVLLLCAGVVLFIAVSVMGIIYVRKRIKGRWKIVSFIGLPQFTANDVLRSFNATEPVETLTMQSASVCKAVLPTGITVSVKKVEWEAKRMKVMSDIITQMGNVRHKNLIRLLGFCYNKHLAYLLYDYLPNGNLAEKIRLKRDWAAKYKIVIGIARGLCHLHHDCYPAIPHGDLKSSNILFDENMEPHLAEFGFKSLVQPKRGSFSAAFSGIETGELNTATKEELYMDIYKFGEVILEILTNGRLTNAGGSIQSKQREVLLREVCEENRVIGSTCSSQEEIKLVLEVALLCTRSRPSDRPSMEDALKLLSGLKPQRK
ncbi:leucine-rich repeat receptor-like protein kinase TDR [Malania oleifera]|uniref:leucine-rich repeat receptor-like protein kinase TDR n=1 Tax=Malania oleifera TaxID=397392 RepID=UPI0025AE1D8C|nr:leucine-rich repeat receptor-like protein kinase TDR [Malania oleifera]